MRVDLRGGVHAGGRGSALWPWGLALLLVVAAGASDATRLTGPRWLLDAHLSLGARGRAHPPRPRRAPPLGGGGLPLWWVWIIVAIAALATAAWLVRLLWGRWPTLPWRTRAQRQRVADPAGARVAEPTPEPEIDVPAVQSGLERALQALSEDRAPGDAVVRAWLGLEETAAGSGIVRGGAETPTEFTARVMSRAVADERPVRTLLDLYLRARFGDHPVGAPEVRAVRAALEQLAQTWSPSARARPGAHGALR